MKTPSVIEKVGQSTVPYRRHDKRMDRYLLLQELKFVNQILGHAAQSGMLLDLCCGTGEVSLMLQTRGFRTLGLDLNLLALAEFQQHSQYVSLIQGNALCLPFWNGSLDVIVALHCFDLLEPVGFLEECSRVLSSQGLLIFDALNRHSYKLALKRIGRFLGPLFPGRTNDKWIDVFSFQEVRQTIDQVGLHLQLASGYGWPPFSVTNNSRLVNVFALVEKVLRLDRLAHVSPRTVMAARKKPDHEQVD